MVTRLSRMASSVRHLTGIAAFLAERGTGLVVLTQGIDTATVAGRFTFHVLAAMDEMLADLISEGTKKAWPPPGPAAGRQPRTKLYSRQAEVARGMYAETGADGKRRYTVDEISGAFAVSRKTIYRHLDNNGAQRQPDKSTRPRPVTRPGDTGATCPGMSPSGRSRPGSGAGPPAAPALRPHPRRAGLPCLRTPARQQARSAPATRGSRDRLAPPRQPIRADQPAPALRELPAPHRMRHR